MGRKSFCVQHCLPETDDTRQDYTGIAFSNFTNCIIFAKRFPQSFGNGLKSPCLFGNADLFIQITLQEAQFEKLSKEMELERQSVARQLEKVCTV